MFAQIYKKNIIEKPKFIFLILIFCLLIFGYNSKNFRLDASSETLLIEGDLDLEYLNEVKFDLSFVEPKESKMCSKKALLKSIIFFELLWFFFNSLCFISRLNI